MNNRKLIPVLQVLGAVIVIAAVVFFVRYIGREDAKEGQPHSLTVSSGSTFREASESPAPSPTEEPMESYLLGLNEEEVAAYLSQVVWDDEFQKQVVEADTETHDDPFYYQKLWLSTHPDYVIPGYDANIYYETSLGDVPSSDELDFSTYAYVNEQKEYTTADGTVITIGTDTPSNHNIIQLDLSYAGASADKPVGFYIVQGENKVNYDYGPSDLKPANMQFDSGYNFIIPNHLMDNVIPAHHTDTCLGAYWTDELAPMGDKRVPDTLHIRAVNLTTGDLLAMFQVTIDFVDGQYKITDVSDSEVSVTGALNEQEREEIINDAYDFFTSVDRGPVITVPDKEYTLSTAKVEAVSRTYFTSLYDQDQDSALQSDFADIDTYAVSMNIDGMGVVTAYYGPVTQVAYNFKSPTAPGSDDLNLTLFGFDATTPFSRDTIMSINGYMP